MEIYVKDRRLRAALEDEATCKRHYGMDMARKIRLRVQALRSAESLGDFWPPESGPERCHELKSDLAGTFSMDLKQPYRLLFIPIEKPKPSSSSDLERWKAMTSIEILRIEDTHA